MNKVISLKGKGAFFRSRVARRIFLLFVLCALIPLTVLAYFSFSQVTRNLYTQTNEHLRLESKALGMATFQRLEFLETDLEMIGTIFEQANKEMKDPAGFALKQKLGDRFKGVLVTTGNGQIKNLLGKLSAVPRLTNDEQNHVRSGKPLILTRAVPGDRTRIYLVKARSRRQSAPALIFSEINPDYLWADEDLSSLTELFVLDQSRNLLFSSFAEYIPLAEIDRALRQNPSLGQFEWTYRNSSFLASYWNLFMVPKFHANWILVHSETKKDMLAPVDNFKNIFLPLVLLTFFVAVLLSLIQIRRNLVPIELLKQATEMIAAKKFGSQVRIRTNDEFEELGNSFNIMAASLENHLRVMTTLNSIGLSLSSEKRNERLLELILLGAKNITNADGCALYTFNEDKQLRVSLIRIDSINLVVDETDDVAIPLYHTDGKPHARSVMAFAAVNDITVNIPNMDQSADFDFPGNPHFGITTGYPLCSLLAVPVKNHENEAVGVLLLMNAQDRVSGEVLPFSGDDQRLLEALASQAAVALSKNKLVEDLSALFDSLVELIATAIDKKSPYTGDHCRRVPELTMMLAEAVCAKKEGVFKDFTLSGEEFHELKIAALLHDCGKVTTPVHIADKATRLETIVDRMHLIDARFDIVKRDAQIAFHQKHGALSETGNDVSAEKQALEKFLIRIEEDREFIRDCNSGETVMDESRRERIETIRGRYRLTNADGKQESVLSDIDVYMLTSATQGTLTPAERAVINQHVEITIKMLESLHYPKSLRNVPLYAQAHHERVDGKGYPKGLTQKEIPLQGRIMAIADIFEAMTAIDRPYKKGMTLREAVHDLGFLKETGHIDPDLFDVFISEKVYLRYAEKYLSPEQKDEVVLSEIPGYASPPR